MYEQSNWEGKRILVVQDDFVEEMQLAFEGTGLPDLSGLTDQTISILEGSDIGAAIFDRNLDPQNSTQIAEALISLGIPFAFASSEEATSLPERLMSYCMTQSPPELQLLAHQLFGRPTYH